MQCVILAGGLATRLRPVTEKIPKSMVEVAGRPFLEHQLDLLKKSGVEDVVLCVGHRAEQIEDYFGDGRNFRVRITYSREGNRLLGTGGALKKAEPFLDREFCLIYGDSYLDIDYRPVFRRFSEIDSSVLMTVYRNRDRWVKSNLLYRDGKVIAFNKKNPSREMEYIDFGLSVFSRDVLKMITGGKPYNLDDLYRSLAPKGELAGYEVSKRFYEIGSPEGLKELRQVLG